MHQSSTWHMQDCIERHVTNQLEPGKVLEIGSGTSADSEPSFRNVFENIGWSYSGLDLSASTNVDIIVSDPFAWQIENNSFDLIISGNMLEHNSMFWISFLEMARVLKPGGKMIHIVPSRGYEHRTPMDCWRIYRDGMDAISTWCGLECVEATTDWARTDLDKIKTLKPKVFEEIPRRYEFSDGAWGDTVGVFKKPSSWIPKTALRYMRNFNNTFVNGNPIAETSLESTLDDSQKKQSTFLPLSIDDWTAFSLHGVQMQVPDKLLTPTIDKALKNKKYDHLKVRQIGSLLKDGDRIMEFGAGLGFISTYASSKAKIDSCVLIEANPDLIPVIKKTHKLNGSNPIIINAVALSSNSDMHDQIDATTNEIPFYITRNFWGASLTAKSEAVSVTHTPVISANNLIHKHKPTVLICDIEGGELDIFEDVDLRGVRIVFLDVHENIIGLKGVQHLEEVMAAQGLYFDPENSIGAAVLYSRRSITK